MTTIFAPSNFAQLDATVLNFRAIGVAGTATAGTTTNIDYLVPEDRLLTGGFLILKGQVWGDNITLRAVDIDGVYAPAGTVLREMATNFYVAEDTQLQKGTEVPYPAKILAGLYLRLIYTSCGLLVPVSVKINYYMHKILA